MPTITQARSADCYKFQASQPATAICTRPSNSSSSKKCSNCRSSSSSSTVGIRAEVAIAVAARKLQPVSALDHATGNQQHVAELTISLGLSRQQLLPLLLLLELLLPLSIVSVPFFVVVYFFFFSFFAVAGWFSQSLVYANCNEFPWPSLSSSSKWAFDFNRWHFHISTAICCWCRQTDRIPHPPVLLATPPLRLPFCINGLPFRFYV